MQYDSKKASVRCVNAAIITVIVLVIKIFLSSVSVWWCLAPLVALVPIAYLYAYIYGFVLGFFADPTEFEDETEYEDYSEMTDEEFEEAQYEWLESIAHDPNSYVCYDENGIEFSTELVGKYKDTNIYEWIVVETPEGNKIKCFYETVVDIDRQFEPPEGWFTILLPGIMYVHREPEN